jgi:hypothetical protein
MTSIEKYQVKKEDDEDYLLDAHLTPIMDAEFDKIFRDTDK